MTRHLSTFREDARRLNLWRHPVHAIAAKVMQRRRTTTNSIAVMVTPGGGVLIAEATRMPAGVSTDDVSRLVGVYAKGATENQILDDLCAWAAESGVVLATGHDPDSECSAPVGRPRRAAAEAAAVSHG